MIKLSQTTVTIQAGRLPYQAGQSPPVYGDRQVGEDGGTYVITSKPSLTSPPAPTSGNST